MYKNRVRLPFYLSRPQFPVERNVFRKADGSSKLLSAIIRNTYEGKTDHLPEDWHRKLIIALTHDEVTIEGTNFLKDVVLDGDYDIDWSDFLDYPVAQSNFKIQVTPFDATNSNCQTCEEITQLELVDDYTDEIWDEGTTHEFPDILTANDTICCYPFVISLMSYNTLYFDSVTIDSDGVLTATVSASVPILNDVLIATYRVTCENGGYDEANVYGNITGTSTECPPPTSVKPQLDLNDGTVASIEFVEPSPAPAGGYDWELFLQSDLFTPVDLGNTSGSPVSLTGLTPGEKYTFVIVSVCGAYDESTPVSEDFTTPVTGTDACGSFTILNSSWIPGSYNFMNCSGQLRNGYFPGVGSTIECMLMDPVTFEPVYFAGSTGFISYVYNYPC